MNESADTIGCSSCTGKEKKEEKGKTNHVKAKANVLSGVTFKRQRRHALREVVRREVRLRRQVDRIKRRLETGAARKNRRG